MSNKKRIRKKILENSETQKRKRLSLGIKILTAAIEIQKRMKIASQSKAKYPIGGVIQSNGNEIIVDQFGQQKGIAIPLKQLEGMLALERQKDGSVKAVFAGSRVYQELKSK